MRLEDKKAAWHAFYCAEQELYRFLNHEVESVYGEPPSYIEYETKSGAMHQRPPRFVHWIGRLYVGGEAAYLGLVDNMRQAYLAANETGRFPVRWPEFYWGIAQVNISVNSAYSSKPMVHGEAVTLKAKRWPEGKAEQNELLAEFAADQLALKQWGLTTVYCGEGVDLNPQGQIEAVLLLSAPAPEVLNVAGCASIQVRKRTGSQYRARIRAAGQSAGKRVKFGLMVLDETSDVNVCLSTPQAPRPHQLSESDRRVLLPIDTNIELYSRI